MSKLKSILIAIVVFCAAFTLMTSSLYVYDVCKKNKEEYYKQICVKEALKNYGSDDEVWGYDITEINYEVGNVMTPTATGKEYLIRIYREPNNKEREYCQQFAIDYYIGGIDKSYIDVDWFKTECIE